MYAVSLSRTSKPYIFPQNSVKVMHQQSMPLPMLCAGERPSEADASHVSKRRVTYWSHRTNRSADAHNRPPTMHDGVTCSTYPNHAHIQLCIVVVPWQNTLTYKLNIGGKSASMSWFKRGPVLGPLTHTQRCASFSTPSIPHQSPQQLHRRP